MFGLLSAVGVVDFFDFFSVGSLIVVIGPQWHLNYGAAAAILLGRRHRGDRKQTQAPLGITATAAAPQCCGFSSGSTWVLGARQFLSFAAIFWVRFRRWRRPRRARTRRGQVTPASQKPKRSRWRSEARRHILVHGEFAALRSPRLGETCRTFRFWTMSDRSPAPAHDRDARRCRGRSPANHCRTPTAARRVPRRTGRAQQRIRRAHRTSVRDDRRAQGDVGLAGRSAAGVRLDRPQGARTVRHQDRCLVRIRW